MGKDLLHKIFVSLRGIKQELYAKSFQVNKIREKPRLKTHVVNLKRDAKELSRDLQRLEVRGKLGSRTLSNVKCHIYCQHYNITKLLQSLWIMCIFNHEDTGFFYRSLSYKTVL